MSTSVIGSVDASKKFANPPALLSGTFAKWLEATGIAPEKRARELSEDELAKLAALLDNEYTVEGQLRRQLQQNIARLNIDRKHVNSHDELMTNTTV